ncbi:MAG: hypothetical protein M3112_09920 [Actinomycetia bacterium]|nr:hypothetical protein [Actinomycetes bacterium]
MRWPCVVEGLIEAGLGLGAPATFLVNPWFLFAVVPITAGIIYWRANRATTNTNGTASRKRSNGSTINGT